MKTVGVIGGMGSYATLDFFNKIICNTPAKEDQNHLHILIDNYPQIPDRTSYLLGKGENPLPYILESAHKLINAGADILCMPCNTAHYFINEIRNDIEIPFVSIVESVYEHINTYYKKQKNIGLIATKGTLTGKVFDDFFLKTDYNLIIPHGDFQEKITKLIYSIKSGVIRENSNIFLNIMEMFKKLNAEVVIAGCTEIPLVLPHINQDLPVIDSNLVLANKVIEIATSSNES